VDAFERHVFDEICRAVEQVTPDAAADVYVVSLLVYDEEDDPRLPTVTVGYNTEARARECTPSRGEAPKWPVASDAGEARWNFAFWLQNELAVVADSEQDPDGAQLRRTWIEGLGLWYSDEEEEADFEGVGERAGRITEEFVALAVRVVERLHATGVVERAFGRPIPVLIHELEYYEEIAEQNGRANPPALVADFTRWVRDL